MKKWKRNIKKRKEKAYIFSVRKRETEKEKEREMVGSGASDRSKEAVGMMALHEALRSVCLNSDWTYSVFWTIRPRPYLSHSLSLLLPLSLSLSLSLSVPLYYAFNWAASLPIIAEESEVVMGAKLETTTAACKFSLVQHSLHYFLSFALKRGRALLLFFFYKQSNYSLNFVNGRWVFFGFLWSIIWDGYSVILSLGSYRFQ